MRIAIVGSRTFTDYDKFHDLLMKALCEFKVNIATGAVTFISGGAIGVDSMAEQFCKQYSWPCKVIKPDWNRYGKSAGFIRNTEIVEDADLVLAFWDGESRGTLDSIRKATLNKKPVYIVGVPNEVV